MASRPHSASPATWALAQSMHEHGASFPTIAAATCIPERTLKDRASKDGWKQQAQNEAMGKRTRRQRTAKILDRVYLIAEDRLFDSAKVKLDADDKSAAQTIKEYRSLLALDEPSLGVDELNAFVVRLGQYVSRMTDQGHIRAADAKQMVETAKGFLQAETHNLNRKDYTDGPAE